MSYATAAADLSDIEALRERSGLEFMQAIQSGEINGAPIAQTLNFDLDEVAEDRVVYSGTPRFPHMNPLSGVHGGWYGAILDAAMGGAVMTRVPCGSTYTILEYKVNIVRALPADTEVRCVGTVSHAGRSNAFASGEIRGVADDCLYATGSATCQIMALPHG